MGVETLGFGFATPKKELPWVERRRLTYFVKIGAHVSAVAFLKNQKK